ncbi:hypothetical protein H311_00446 [Anncaliia algerae PRA109]|nr:hypothetical protein H311_00446 [Anncaliia algerae PRA109]
MLIYLLAINCLVEEGYLYSVNAKKFLTYHPTHLESRIFLASENVRPKKFRINELKPPFSGSVRLTPVERDPPNVVVDKSGYNNDMIQFEEHGKVNQIFTLEMVPKMLVKLKNDGMCFTTPSDTFYLKAVECKNYEADPGQYYRWIPDTLEKLLHNPSSLESFIRGASKKMKNYNDCNKNDPRSCYSDYKPIQQSRPVDVPSLFDIKLPPQNNNPRQNNRYPYDNDYRACDKYSNYDGDELLDRLHEFDRIMLLG